MPQLRSIVYVSTAVHPMDETELEGLLVESQRLNMESHTTGVLLYSEGSFMQCFEGTSAAIAVTWQRIRASRRHTGIIELLDEPVPARSFEGWEMGFARAKRSEILALSSARWRHQAGAKDDTGSAGLQLLKDFWVRAHR